MKAEDINKYILEIKYNKVTQKHYWEIYINGNTILKSDREYKTEKDAKIHLISISNAFRYLLADGQIDL